MQRCALHAFPPFPLCTQKHSPEVIYKTLMLRNPTSRGHCRYVQIGFLRHRCACMRGIESSSLNGEEAWKRVSVVCISSFSNYHSLPYAFNSHIGV